MFVWLLLCLTAILPVQAQTTLDDAYAALRANQMESAANLFARGLSEKPEHLIARKDYAYTLLRLGETASARDQFGEVFRRDPKDFVAALEYAFLCHETRRRGEARRIFDLVRRQAEGESRESAESAFQSVDGALAAGLAQWSEAVIKDSNSDSVHEELARLAEDRDQLELAEDHFAAAFRLKPSRRELLLDLGRVRRAMNREDSANAAYLAAFRSEDTRISEQGREHLPDSQLALAVVEESLALEPKRSFAPKRQSELSALDMADRSYQLGYLKDALQYYENANESAPGDPHVELRLGLVNNMLGRDKQAYQWFAKARRSDDPLVAAEAQTAWKNLRPQQALFRPTIWFQPMYSSRWHSGFVYGQSKIEFNTGTLPLRPYVSLRFVGDTGAVNAPAPLSERSVTPAIGVATKAWHGLTAWGEAGVNLGHTKGADSRAGLFHSKGLGPQMGAESPGVFYLVTNAVNYASRFSNDVMFSSQHRAGYTFGRLQVGWLVSAGVDTQRQYWANYGETGPTISFRLPWLRPATALAFDLVRGRNFVMSGNPRSPDYWDARVGLWYALTY